VREGNRVVIREGDRSIIREGGGRAIIRHNEASRFAINARNVQVERHGANTETIIERPNGVRIVNIADADGRLIRRVRRDRDGREIIIIDNSYGGPRASTMFIELPPPVIRIPRDHYIVEADRARPQDIYAVFMAPPVEVLPERYTLDQVRFSEPLRERMPRVDLDINFDTGSWQLTSDQVDRLAAIADGLNRAMERNPREVFMIEGHTDALGNDDDNLSLSDRRAESVAVALTEQFQVPAENLVTQGYGEQYLKVPSSGPERANRRVAIRRITPLLTSSKKIPTQHDSCCFAREPRTTIQPKMTPANKTAKGGNRINCSELDRTSSQPHRALPVAQTAWRPRCLSATPLGALKDAVRGR
jgi:OOP family OmpA-OmpF porin